MASKSEVGYNKNVANYSAAYQILTEMGSMYNPTNTSITLAGLEPLKAALANDMANLNGVMAEYRAFVAQKDNAIDLMDKKSTKIINYFRSLDVPKNEVENINARVKKIRGDKRKPIAKPEEGDNTEISNSQQSFDNKVANFNALIVQLEQFPEYAPNEDDIKIATLQAYTEELAGYNNNVTIATAGLITARAARNNNLFFDDPNVINLIKRVKAYVKSLGLPAQPYYKALVRLKFVDYKK